MITVLPLADSKEIKNYFEKEKIPFGDNSGCVTAREKDKVLGYCLYDLDEKGITVHTLYPVDNLMLADGILRSALHIAAQRSAMDARYSSTAPEELFSKLGFIKNAEEKTLDIDKLFGECCCGK